MFLSEKKTDCHMERRGFTTDPRGDSWVDQTDYDYETGRARQKGSQPVRHTPTICAPELCRRVASVCSQTCRELAARTLAVEGGTGLSTAGGASFAFFAKGGIPKSEPLEFLTSFSLQRPPHIVKLNPCRKASSVTLATSIPFPDLQLLAPRALARRTPPARLISTDLRASSTALSLCGGRIRRHA